MKRLLKWVGLGLGGLVLLLLAAVAVMYFQGGAAIDEPLTLDDEPLAVSADSAMLARGEYLVNTHACRDCHGAELAGQVFAEAPPFLAVASNLTAGAGGIGSGYSDADWERAIRHGVGANGRRLIIMPSALYNALSDDEVSAMIAYLKSVPPIDNALPQTEVRPMGRILTATGAFYTADTPIDHTKAHTAAAPPHAATEEYGRYRVQTLCTYCHGPDLHGGDEPVEPGTPLPPDLFSVTAWSLDQFKTAMRTGVTPSGHELNPMIMPWTAFQHMDDAEIEAIYKYLQTLEPADAAAQTAGV